MYRKMKAIAAPCLVDGSFCDLSCQVTVYAFRQSEQTTEDGLEPSNSSRLSRVWRYIRKERKSPPSSLTRVQSTRNKQKANKKKDTFVIDCEACPPGEELTENHTFLPVVRESIFRRERLISCDGYKEFRSVSAYKQIPIHTEGDDDVFSP